LQGFSALKVQLGVHSKDRQDKAPQGQASGGKVAHLPAHPGKQGLALEEKNGWNNHKTRIFLISLENIMNSLYI
jgi:hypothetical protein